MGGKPTTTSSSSSSTPQAQRGCRNPSSISRNKDSFIFPRLSYRTTPRRSNGSSDAIGGKGQGVQVVVGAVPQAGAEKTGEGGNKFVKESKEVGITELEA
ncbi:MAG: hypothetical protein Q9173_000214, partial [Seirophora scorigena]